MGPTVFNTAKMRKEELGGGMMLTEVSALRKTIFFVFHTFAKYETQPVLKLSKLSKLIGSFVITKFL